ncbi:MAG: AbrB/MazE/SpoVT family DNA-binding domain-containing protein [Chloroflexi bacterium]|nr:AbrB/MazE/SpoVT family DNA-binding domain-containing protein [Chloroflexota bacterium]
MATTKVSGKGGIVIPKELRQRYGLKNGDRVQVVDYGGMLAIVPAVGDPVRTAHGMLKGGKPLVKALLESRREDAAREETGS